MFGSAIFAGLPTAGSAPVDVKEYMGPGAITLVEGE